MISQRHVVVLFGVLYLCFMFYLHYNNYYGQFDQHTQPHNYDDEEDLNSNSNNDKNNNNDNNNNNNNDYNNNEDNNFEIEENRRRVDLITSIWDDVNITEISAADVMKSLDLREAIRKVKQQNKNVVQLKLKLLEMLGDDENDADRIKQLLRNFKRTIKPKESGAVMGEEDMQGHLYNRVMNMRVLSKESSLDYNIPQYCRDIIEAHRNFNKKNNNDDNKKNNISAFGKNDNTKSNGDKKNGENIFWRQSYETNTVKAFENNFKFKQLATSAFVYSAFYDNRVNDLDNRLNVSYVRVMVVKDFAEVPLYCVFQKYDSQQKQHYNKQKPQQNNHKLQQQQQFINQSLQQHSQPNINTQHQKVEAPLLFVSRMSRTYEMNENHKKPYGGYILSCQVPEELKYPPCYVTLYHKDPEQEDFNWDAETDVSLPVLILEAESTKAFQQSVEDFSNGREGAGNASYKEPGAAEVQSKTKHTFNICVPPLHGHVTRRQLIEFVEFSLLLGFEKIFFYVYEADTKILNLLEYYSVHRKAVEVLPWLLPTKLEKTMIWYNAQIISVQDCLYRNMAMSEFVLFSDLDEIFVPRSTIIWPSLLPLLRQEQWCAFCASAAYFVPGQVEQCGEEIRQECVSILTTITRTKMTDKIRTKCMVKPRLLFESGIHHVSRPSFSHYKISQLNQSVALLHHYRECKRLRMFPKCEQKIEDRHTHLYSKALLKKIQQVLEEVQLWEGLSANNNDEKKAYNATFLDVTVFLSSTSLDVIVFLSSASLQTIG